VRDRAGLGVEVPAGTGLRAAGEAREVSATLAAACRVIAIANTSAIDATKLAEAITVIFERRAEHRVPASLPEPPAEWTAPWRRLARDVPATDDIAEGYRVAVTLLHPVLDGTVTTGAWRPGDGWPG
jgi:hypothetical protein